MTEAPSSGRTQTEDLDVGRSHDWVDSIFHGWKRLRHLPWSGQLIAILFFAGLLLIFAPFGGYVSHLLRAKSVAEEQAVGRGKALALALAARNQDYIVEQNNLVLDANFLLGEPGVKLTEITDNRGVVRAPAEKVSQTIGNKEWFVEASTIGRTYAAPKEGGEWHILVPIRARVVDGAPATISGWAYVLFDVGAVSADAAPVTGRLVGSILVLVLGLGGAGLSIWRLVGSPVAALREELELALRGHLDQVQAPMEWANLRDLAHSVNRLLTRWQQAPRGPAAAPAPVRTPPPSMIPSLSQVVEGLAVPVFILDAESRIVHASQAASGWLGLPQTTLKTMRIGDVLPEPAFLDMLSRACARVARQEVPGVSEAATVGANQARISVTLSEADGVLAVVSIG